MRSRSPGLVVALAATLTAGCADDEPRGVSYGQPCEMDSDCPSGICTPPIFDAVNTMYAGPACTNECSTDEDCAGIVSGSSEPYPHTCGTAADGRRICLLQCETPGFLDFDTGVRAWYCIDGRQVAAEQSPCAACGASEYCDSETVTCVPRKHLGYDCTFGYECQSGRCAGDEPGADERRCLVAIGEPCGANPDFCPTCLTYGTTTFCSSPCNGYPGVCGPTNVSFCAGYRGDDASYLCRKRCRDDAECGPDGTCETVDHAGSFPIRACF